jgi:hypothetical protein
MNTPQPPEPQPAPPTVTPESTDQSPPPTTPPKEIGGRQGPDPTRYGDWEKAGRCIDF